MKTRLAGPQTNEGGGEGRGRVGRHKQARREALPLKALSRKADSPSNSLCLLTLPECTHREKSTLTQAHSQTHEHTQKHTALSQWAVMFILTVDLVELRDTY